MDINLLSQTPFLSPVGSENRYIFMAPKLHESIGILKDSPDEVGVWVLLAFPFSAPNE